ncbi:hypothetical protein D3H65_06970 [Paraflavitalea soli]|uniref:Uncharacterized protein n=1 Tax=Paraflavitalea soli TaxID=2315862 RepID=A0A3B7MKA8_9BACT|nr:hypothetical protein [Paraflavitalea soli]AXY73733.1 hypothetical protein D3H65_06970 [Paraflavitalea soli]
MINSSKPTALIWTVFGTAVAVSWLAFIVYFPVLIGLAIWCGALLYLFIKRTKLKWWLLLVSAWVIVPLLSFVAGSSAYFQGKATIETFGLPDEEFYNLDPDLRVWYSTSGCVVMETEPFKQTPNNWAVRFWTRLLGPQNDVYKGGYPTREEVAGYIGQGKRLHYFQSGDTVSFDEPGQPLLLEVNRYNDLDIFRKTSTAVLFELNKECLLVQPVGEGVENVVFLADKRGGKIFARYYDYPAVAATVYGIDTVYKISSTHQPYMVTGHFNADVQLDTVILVKHGVTGAVALYIKHGGGPSFVLKNGEDVGGLFEDLQWVGQLAVIKKGEVIFNNVVDGEIVGEQQVPDNKKIRLEQDGIFVHEEEGGGGGILYFKQGKYVWVQQD